MRVHARLAELSRFGVNGILLNVLLFAVYAGLVKLDFPPLLVVAIFYPVGVLLSYLVHRRFTFRASSPFVSSGIRFVFAYAAGYALNLGLLWTLIEWLRFDPIGAQALAVLVVAAFLYGAQKFWVFAGKKKPEAALGSSEMNSNP